MMPKTLYITDLDGTLLGADSRVSARSAALLTRAIERGALVSVATARTPSTVSWLLEGIRFRLPLIVMTGAAVWCQPSPGYPHGQYLRTVTMPRRAAAEAVRVIKEHGLPCFMFRLPTGPDTDGRIQIWHHGALSEIEREFVAQRVDSPYKNFRLDEPMPDGDDDVILFYGMQPTSHVMETYRDLKGIEGLNVLAYHDIYGPETAVLEIFDRNATKASAIEWLKKQTGAERVVVFGDNINDLPMMRMADVAVAVGNAVPQVLEAAHEVIGPNTGDSVASYIVSRVMEGVEGVEGPPAP